MGCSASCDGVVASAAATPLADPATLCRQRAALARAAADRRSALADAHTAYFRSLDTVGGALRRFAAAALAAPSARALALPPSPAAAIVVPSALPSSPSPLTSSVSPLSDENIDAPRPNATRGGGGIQKASLSSTTTPRRMMRTSPTVPAVVYEDPYARPQYAEVEASYVYVHGGAERPSSSPPPASPWDFFFDPFAHCDGFVEDYYRSCCRNLPGSSISDSADKVGKMEGITEVEEETTESAGTIASSKPSTSRGSAGDQNAKAKAPIPDDGASNRDGKLQGTASKPAHGVNSEANKRPDIQSPPSNATSSKEGVKQGPASLLKKGAAPAPGANNAGKKGKAASSNGGRRSKEEGDKKTSPAASSKGAARSEATSSPPILPMHLGTTRSVVAAAMDEVYWLFTEAANRGVAVSRALGKGKAVVARRTKLRAALAVSTTSSCCVPHPRGRESTNAPRSERSTPSSSSLGAGRTNDAHELSSTLEKLWVWETKLYREVKDKGKLRRQYKKMHRTLKSLEQRGAESSSVDSTQQSVRLLRSKMSVSTSTAAALSLMIAKTRDEELHPQLADLIQRFRALWKSVLDCHEKQLSAIQAADIHRLNAVTLSQSAAASAASEELERGLKNWRRCFHRWTGSQNAFVEAVNRWLDKWLPDQLQEQDAQRPAFAISKKWLQATEKVSTAEVLRAADHFSKLVHGFRKSQEDEHRRKEKADRASRDYHARREDLKAAFGLITGPDVAVVMENPCYRHDDRVRDLVRASRRRDEERARHEEFLNHAHVAASATLPLGLVPMLQQIIAIFQRNLQAYMEIRTQGAT